MREQSIYVAEYDDVQIKVQNTSLDRQIGRKQIKFAPPGLDAWVIGQLDYIDVDIQSLGIFCEAMKFKWHGDVPLAHVLEHVDILADILASPLDT